MTENIYRTDKKGDSKSALSEYAEMKEQFSIESLQQQERIAARRHRMKERLYKPDSLDMAKGSKKLADNLQPYYKEYIKSKKQIKNSYERLLKLKSHGSELVTNVQVATTAREIQRRGEEESVQQKRIEKLEIEANEAAEKFDTITSRWRESIKKETPYELNKVLSIQRDLCASMIDEKNKLIDEMQEELKRQDNQYVKDLRKQAEDIDLMLDRMEEETKSLAVAFEEELNEIEKQYQAERSDLTQAQRKKYDQLALDRHEKEVGFMKAYESSVEDFTNQLQTLRVQDAEEYNMVKIKLETDVQILQQNIQQMKATFQLNQEKLEYNFQVLKKRDEENTVTKSQQKRKITRLQDVLNNLKQRCKKQELQYTDDRQSLLDDVNRITEQHLQLQKKARHFQSTDVKRLKSICEMNDEQAKEYIGNLLTEDEIIHEQLLGLDWRQPQLPYAVAPRGAVTSVASKSGRDQQLLAEEGSESSQRTEQTQSNVGDTNIKRMLDRLCDESGFLIESKLMTLLASLDKDEQSLMKLDAIFTALGIKSEYDVRLLSQYFYKHPVPSAWQGSVVDEQIHDSVEQLDRTLIHPNEVLMVLRRFSDDHKSTSRAIDVKRKSSGYKSQSDKRFDSAYWSDISCVIDKRKERLWDALTDGLVNYSHLLNERSVMIDDTNALQLQNQEFRMILRQYMNSKVNQELEIPPTRILQLDGRK